MPTRKNRPYPSGYYGHAHKTMRRRFEPVVQRGTVLCARCGELIEPGSPWQLDHRDDGRGWLGPSHQSCNARAGWEKMVAANGHRAELEEKPYRWSQRWTDDPPVGTIKYDGGRNPEIYVGNGDWQPLDEPPLT